ncbi:MAG: DUF402 domain-containing protein [Nocardiaceae bacterium]|nr:DUF402 domain-containing protein [Nocardiaceae bacterium]
MDVATVTTTNNVVHVHKPKVEHFNIKEWTNIDPKGFVRPVEKYLRKPWGLYMGREADHANFHYIESWLLPSLGLRVTIFHFHPYKRRDQNYYIDIGDFTPGKEVWHSTDHYLDIVVRTGRNAELLDVDELLAAQRAGLIDPATAEKAIDKAVTAMTGIAQHGYRLESWLSSLGIDLTWR